MNADSFSLKARRTTRIPLRIPIVLAFREDGAEKERSIDAWTLIVNVNGARVECKQLFETGKEVTLRVPHLGKSQKGSVVWRDANANKNGGYECGIKLEKPENLWGVGFPPADWTPKASGIDDLLPSKPAPAPSSPAPISEVAATGSAPSATERSTSRTVLAQDQHVSSAQDPPAEQPIPAEAAASAEEAPSGGDAAHEQVRVYGEVDLTQDLTRDLTRDLPELAVPETRNRMQEFLASNSAAGPGGTAEPGPELTDRLPEFPATVQGTPRSGIGPETFMQGLPTAQRPATAAAGLHNPSDRLSTIFNELVESALQQRLHGLVEGLAARMEMRITAIETAAVTQVEQRITDMVRSQSELLEGRAAVIVSTRQLALEEGVRKYLADQEEEARSAQQEMMQETFRVMCEEMGQTSSSTRQHLAEQAEEIVSATRTNLWQSVQQELPALEQEVLARGKAQAEQATAACFDEVNRRLPEKIQEAEQSVSQRMDRAMEERLSQFTAGLTERSEQLYAESRARIEHQIEEVWKQTSQAFLRHIVGELNQKKHVWLQEAEGSLRELSDQNLAWTRRRTTQFLKGLGASLVERAGEEDAESEQAAAPFGERKDQKEQQEMAHFVAAHAGE